jgi:hypothetical protein
MRKSTGFWSSITDDATIAELLATVDGIQGTYAIELPSGDFLVGCSAEGLTGCQLEQLCAQVIDEANRIAWMFEDSEVTALLAALD